MEIKACHRNNAKAQIISRTIQSALRKQGTKAVSRAMGVGALNMAADAITRAILLMTLRRRARQAARAANTNHYEGHVVVAGSSFFSERAMQPEPGRPEDPIPMPPPKPGPDVKEPPSRELPDEVPNPNPDEKRTPPMQR